MMASCSALVMVATGKVMQADLLTRLGIADGDRDAAHSSVRLVVGLGVAVAADLRETDEKFVQVLGRGWRRGYEGLA